MLGVVTTRFGQATQSLVLSGIFNHLLLFIGDTAIGGGTDAAWWWLVRYLNLTLALIRTKSHVQLATLIEEESLEWCT